MFAKRKGSFHRNETITRINKPSKAKVEAPKGSTHSRSLLVLEVVHSQLILAVDLPLKTYIDAVLEWCVAVPGSKCSKKGDNG